MYHRHKLLIKCMIDNFIYIIIHIINNFISMLYHQIADIDIFINVKQLAPRTELTILLVVDGILVLCQPL